jgi:hypothetical protein
MCELNLDAITGAVIGLVSAVLSGIAGVLYKGRQEVKKNKDEISNELLYRLYQMEDAIELVTKRISYTNEGKSDNTNKDFVSLCVAWQDLNDFKKRKSMYIHSTVEENIKKLEDEIAGIIRNWNLLEQKAAPKESYAQFCAHGKKSTDLIATIKNQLKK